MYSTVKYTDDTRNSRKEKQEWKIRRDTLGYNMPCIHWILRHLNCVLSPTEMDLHGKRFSDLDKNTQRIRSSKTYCLVISMEIQRHEKCVQHHASSILRNCAVHRIYYVILI